MNVQLLHLVFAQGIASAGDSAHVLAQGTGATPNNEDTFGSLPAAIVLPIIAVGIIVAVVVALRKRK